jgi:phosphoserine aminotransferase
VTRDVLNFGAGPGALPPEVLKKAQRELLDFSNTGMSVMEISHRHKVYEEVQQKAEDRLRSLMGISESYRILFLQGGASQQFALLPMNFLGGGHSASYVLTGSWSEKAFEEARHFGSIKLAGSTKDENYRRIPNPEELDWDPSDRYVHITSNNTIFGSQWRAFPSTGNVPLVADMSSDILSRAVDVNEFELIYAGAQKNLGPSGVTVVVVQSEWLKTARQDIPTILRYDTHARHHSLYNTPPTFSVYMLGLVLEWVEAQGGVSALEARNDLKAKLIYQAIDESGGFYTGHVDDESRSRMNITFRLPSSELEQAFLAAAADDGFVGLNGHRSIGGCRASLYNAVPVENCERLADFMIQFRRQS